MDINLSEEDTKKRYIDPALKNAGWDFHTHISLEYAIKANHALSDGAINLKTKMRGKARRADYALFAHGVCVAIIEAKAYAFEDSEGIEQAKQYAKVIKDPLAFSSSGKGEFEIGSKVDVWQVRGRSFYKISTTKALMQRYFHKDFLHLSKELKIKKGLQNG